MAVRIALLAMFVVVSLGFATAQTSVDWTLGKSYTSYTTQSFKPGGTLVFNYDTSQHNVLVVNKSDYDNCNTASPLQKFTDGKTTITLKQGASYYICGTPGHCSAGMKLQVNVAGGGSSSTPTTPTTPSTTPSTTPAPTTDTPTVTPSAPSPKDSNSAVSVSSVGVVMTLVMSTLFAFMC